MRQYPHRITKRERAAVNTLYAPSDTSERATSAIRCPECGGQVIYLPTAALLPERFHNGGPALSHIPPNTCAWFAMTPASEIIAYVNRIREQQTRRVQP